MTSYSVSQIKKSKTRTEHRSPELPLSCLAAQTTIMQNLQYWDHTAEPMAEFLHYLITQHDFTQLTDEILREISNKEFKDATTKEVKDTPNPKTFATFLVTLASLAPKAILKNLGLLVHQLDSEVHAKAVILFPAGSPIFFSQSYNIRMAIIDVIAGLIIHLTEQSDDNPGQKEQINGFFDILEERMLDPIAFVRSRDLQAYLRLLEYAFSITATCHGELILFY